MYEFELEATARTHTCFGRLCGCATMAPSLCKPSMFGWWRTELWELACRSPRQASKDGKVNATCNTWVWCSLQDHQTGAAQLRRQQLPRQPLPVALSSRARSRGKLARAALCCARDVIGYLVLIAISILIACLALCWRLCVPSSSWLKASSCCVL
jgi:hypothetical protein